MKIASVAGRGVIVLVSVVRLQSHLLSFYNFDNNITFFKLYSSTITYFIPELTGADASLGICHCSLFPSCDGSRRGLSVMNFTLMNDCFYTRIGWWGMNPPCYPWIHHCVQEVRGSDTRNIKVQLFNCFNPSRIWVK